MIDFSSTVPTGQEGNNGVNKKYDLGEIITTLYLVESMCFKKEIAPQPDPRTTMVGLSVSFGAMTLGALWKDWEPLVTLEASTALVCKVVDRGLRDLVTWTVDLRT
jgi:hypothetical protein